MKRNLVLGYCANDAFEVIEPFLASFTRHCVSAELCLFAAGMDARFHREAERLGIRVEDPAPFLSPDLHFLNARFLMYRGILREHGGSYDHVLLTDIRGVIFQGDPFGVPRERPVYFAAEDCTIRSDPANSKGLRELYGEAVFDEIADNALSCAGATIGTTGAIAAYIEYMCFSFEVRKFDGRLNVHQVIHNFIAWKVRPAFAQVDLAHRIAGAVTFTPVPRIRISGEMISVDGAVPPVIHQWDQSPELAAFIAQSDKFKLSPAIADGPKIVAAVQGGPAENVAAGVAREAASRQERDGSMKKVAVITDATSSGFFFPRWLRYYGNMFGPQNLHVLTYDGLKPEFLSAGLGNVWEMKAGYDDDLRRRVISDLVSVLLNTYDVVLRCDVDEFLVPDARLHGNLFDFVQANKLPYVTANGVDIIELSEDPAFDPQAPVLRQRKFGIRTTPCNKTALTTAKLQWAAGFHSTTVFPRFAGLYNCHLKFADIKGRIAWHEQMLTGLKPDSKEYNYFAVGADHLIRHQAYIANKPKSGNETPEQFDQNFLDSVTYNPIHGIYQGHFKTQDFLFPLSEYFHPEIEF